jgi:hypothetical protein
MEARQIMKRFPIIGALLLIPALALFLMVGCTSGTKDKDKDKDKQGADGKDKDNKDKDKTVKEIAAPGKATVKGVVKYKGTPPTAEDEPEIAKHKTDAALCMAATKEADKKKQMWIIKDGGVANVVVSLDPPEGSEYKVDKKFRSSFKEDKDKRVYLDQPYCAYEPHVVAVYADVQPLIVKNSGKLSHNTSIKPGPKNQEMNKLVPPGEELPPLFFKYESNPINISCSAHGWMNGKLLVFNHPYFAVTKDNGSFEIDEVPVGAELVVHMWHEATGKKEMKKLTTKEGTNTLDLEISK